MATPGKAGKKEKKKPVPVKTSLNSPYDLKWAPLEKGHARFILKTVSEKLDTLGLRKNNVKVFRKWGNRKERKKKRSDRVETSEPIQLDIIEPIQLDSTESTTVEAIQLHTNESTPVESTQLITTELKPTDSIQIDTPGSEPSSVERGWTVKDLRKQLAIGINEVTKGLELNELSLVLVCDSVRPAHITAHLIPLSKTRSVPACQLPGLSSSIAPSLGISSVLALGFKRAADVFSDTVTALVPKMPPVGVAWVPKETPGPAQGEQGSPTVQQSDQSDQCKQQSEESGKRKRKLELSPEAKEPRAELQPLKVKKIIPNPSKIRKPKQNKAKKK
ncbi:ribonuclease P protein subunit p38 [Trichomycterus rosablanca]|uniref:ribonuclease P protein subunit p38 n=1 Tax=Trichomycterus rosablanca TaxID=2290929 RepID=UPI002F352BCF